jgi:hypothetical protein
MTTVAAGLKIVPALSMVAIMTPICATAVDATYRDNPAMAAIVEGIEVGWH